MLINSNSKVQRLCFLFQAGPSGSQFGVIAALFVEIFRWNKDNNPLKATIKMIVMLLVLFAVGIIPSIDNYAHLFGFFFGLLLAIAVRPYKSLRKKEFSKGTRICCSVVCIVLALALFGMLIILFYVVPVYECDTCSYFNCVPFTADFCDEMYVTIGRSQSEL